MLQIKNFSRRFAALSLTGLLLLSAGCGNASEPAAEPTPSQAVSTPAPTSAPEPAPTPAPAGASSPTDVNASANRPPVMDVSVEREAPSALHFLTYTLAFTATNDDGQTLSYDGSNTSGTMEFAPPELSSVAGHNVHFTQIPYSSHLTCELEKASGDGEWGIEILGAPAHLWYHCVAKGDGKPESLEYDAGGELTVRAEKGKKLELTLAMPDSVLGESGWIRLTFNSAEQEVTLKANGSTLSFSGLDPKSATPVSLDYGGFFTGMGKVLDLTSGSGTLDFSDAANGNINVTAA